MRPALWLILLLATVTDQDLPLRRIHVTTSAGDHVILQINVRDVEAASQVNASALLVSVDGRESRHVVLTPGAGRTSYDTLIGPLEPGDHEITLAHSPYWNRSNDLVLGDVAAQLVHASDPRGLLLAHAPTLGLRADTIGTNGDLPLMMYVEDQRRNGDGWVRYSIIFSNEDGGTPPPALMARWGRTTDIELAFEVEWQSGRVVRERYQGPDHTSPSFAGAREGDHPYLLVATLNNMFLDRGLSVASVRPVPVLVDLNAATRESVMDARPWIYRVMARELAEERRLGPDVADPREYLYVEARLDLENAAVSVLAGHGDRWIDSSRGMEELAVNRNGWVRIAVMDGGTASSVRWNCRARPAAPGAVARCRIETARAFRLDRAYTVGPNLLEPARIEMHQGVGDAFPLREH
jgi:hypothetical protein